MPKQDKIPESKPVPMSNEDEGDSHSCSSGQVGQHRVHRHADGQDYSEECQNMGGGTYSWRVV
jgi:hypothetical protein